MKQEYATLIFDDKSKAQLSKQKTILKPRHFIGPSSISLEMQHVIPIKDDEKGDRNTIYSDYCVTDKADGYRKMLYISKTDGKVYLINTQMEFQYTGMICKQKDYFNTLLDGEHITKTKDGKKTHLFAIFDIYFYQGDDVRDHPFLHVNDEDNNKKNDEKYDKEDDKDEKEYEYTRYDYIKDVITNIDYTFISEINRLQILVKSFHIYPTILEANKIVLQTNQIYEVDGLIFTPISLGVGMENKKDKIVNHKKTWTKSLKWKPPQYNTVDFLILDKGEIQHKYLQHADRSIEYKTLTLCVGYDPTNKQHGLIQPCETILHNKIHENKTQGYRYIPFPPSSKMNVECINNHFVYRKQRRYYRTSNYCRM